MSSPEVRADVERTARTGEPELIYAAGKTPEQTVAAVDALASAGVTPIIVTRASPAHAAAVMVVHPSAVHHRDAEVVVLDALAPAGPPGRIVVATAGTSDLRVAYECVHVLRALGHRPELLADVGVAGLHRVMDVRHILEDAEVAIVVAGMEAALGPVVAGLVSPPIIAVPTSVGYGAAQQGMTALHGLLASCAPGIGVVNIDNGVGAALLARRLLASTDRAVAKAVGGSPPHSPGDVTVAAGAPR